MVLAGPDLCHTATYSGVTEAPSAKNGHQTGQQPKRMVSETG